MQAQFNDYPHLYSGKYFEPYSPEPIAAERSATKLVLYWLAGDDSSGPTNHTASVFTDEQSASLMSFPRLNFR